MQAKLSLGCGPLNLLPLHIPRDLKELYYVPCYSPLSSHIKPSFGTPVWIINENVFSGLMSLSS